MKVLVVNGSPRGAQGNTECLLQAFLEGAQKAGAETEVVYLKGKHIEHCLGCFTCWTKTPGVCVHKDDIPELLDKVRYANVLVFATPLYIYTVSGLMKDFMDRLLPLAQPYILQRGHQFTHPQRYPGAGNDRIVVISNSGFPERHHFSGLEETFRRFTDSPDDELAGMICCAGGELLRQPALQDQVAWYLEATKKAGQEVVEQGYISPETQEVLDRPLMDDPAVYANMANAYWRSLGIEMIDFDNESGVAAGPPEPAAYGTPLPLPKGRDTMRDLVGGMALVFSPQAAGDLEAVIQFNVTGEEAEAGGGTSNYYLDIGQGSCRAYGGEYPNPILTIDTPSEVWLAISRGEMNGATALMRGKYSVKGNLGLLMRFTTLFSDPLH